MPATPLWSVRDNFAHMAGVAADVVGGDVEGVATDPWTQAQVDSAQTAPSQRSSTSWSNWVVPMDDLITAVGDAMDPRLFLDQWTHEQDIRATVAKPGWCRRGSGPVGSTVGRRRVDALGAFRRPAGVAGRVRRNRTRQRREPTGRPGGRLLHRHPRRHGSTFSTPTGSAGLVGGGRPHAGTSNTWWCSRSPSVDILDVR